MKGANQVLRALNHAGFEAYIVGGAVRDILMHRKPHDFDIVTSAKPDEVVKTLEEAGYKTSGLVGKSFGVVVAILPEGHYEVATYRRETYGADSHRPETIEYADTLEEDVMRRDFTVNGMAMDQYGEVIDLVGGRRDIKHKRLQTIGDPKERFQEDALRLFRACRFVGKLDFLPTKDLLDAMPSAFHRVSGLSLERVKSELEQLLLEPAVAKGLDVLVQSRLAECSCKVNRDGVVSEIPILPELFHLVNLPQEKDYHAFDGWYHTLAVVDAIDSNLTLRWAALLHDVAKGLPDIRGFHNGRMTDRGHDIKGAHMAGEILTRLGYKKDFVKRIQWLVENHMRFHYFVTHGEADAYKWMRKEARSGVFRYTADLQEACLQLAQVCAADVIGCGKPNSSTDGTLAFGDYLVRICEGMPIHTKDLAYDQRLLEVTGSQTGIILPYLLRQVQNGQVKNNADQLLEAAKRKLRRQAMETRGEV